MAISDKNILITPNVSGILDVQPTIKFTGADSSVGDSASITITALSSDSGTLSFTGSAGQLFSITNSFVGTIFAVSDVSGIPSIQVNDDGIVQIAGHNGKALFGTTTDSGNTDSDVINVDGNVRASNFVGQTINTQTGTTYTAVLKDEGRLVTLNNGSAITLTIPADSNVSYNIGTKIDLCALGAGQVTVAGAAGATINATPGLKLRAQYSAASCIKYATNTWVLVGDLEA